MERSQMRDLWLIPLTVLVFIPALIFELVAALIGRPSFKHGPYNGHEYPEDI